MSSKTKIEIYCPSSYPLETIAKVSIFINHTLPVDEMDVKRSIFVVLLPGWEIKVFINVYASRCDWLGRNAFVLVPLLTTRMWTYTGKI